NLANQSIGLAIDSSGNLWVSDGLNNRVLRYPASALGAQPSNDPAADLVLGQPDFVTTALPKDFAITSKGTLNQPGALAFSPSGLLFVADSATPGRVLVYPPPFSSGQSAARIMGVIVVATGAQPPAPIVFSE